MQNHQVLAGYTGGSGENYQIYYGQNSGHLSGTGYRFSIPGQVEEPVPIFDPVFDIVDIGLDFLDVGPGGGFQDTNTDPIIENFTEFDYSQPFNEEFQQEPFEQVFENNFETAFEEHFEEFHDREDLFEETFEDSFESSREISDAIEEARDIAEDREEEAEEREEELAEEREEEAEEKSNEEDRLSPEELAALEAKSDQEENLNELEDKLASDEAAASEERSEKLEEELAVTDAIQEEQLQQEQGQSKIESQAERVGLRGDQSQLRVESALAAAGPSSLQMLASASGTQSVTMSQQEQMQAMIGTTESAFFGAAANSLTGMGGLSAFGGTGSLNEGTQLSQSALGDLAGGDISQLTQSDLLLGRMDPPAEKPAREPVESDISGDESATIEAMATVPGFSQYTVASPQVQPNFYTSSSPYGRTLRDNNLRMYQMSNDAVWEKLRGDQYGR
jgi:hypothetical protein